MSQGKSSGGQVGIIAETRTVRPARVPGKLKYPDPNGNRRHRRAYAALQKVKPKQP